MKCVAAAILVLAGIGAGAIVATIRPFSFPQPTPPAGAEWKWIAAAIVVEAIIVAGAILIPELRPKLLLAAAVAVFMTAVAVAFLLPSRVDVGLGGWMEITLGERILLAGVGLVVGLILASFTLERGDGGPSTYGFTEDPGTARDRFPGPPP